jgi:hypothetical protein
VGLLPACPCARSLSVLGDRRQRSAAKSAGIMEDGSIVPPTPMCALGDRRRVQSSRRWCEAARSRDSTGINQIRYLARRSASEPRVDSHSESWLHQQQPFNGTRVPSGGAVHSIRTGSRSSFDHRIGAQEVRGRQFDANRLRAHDSTIWRGLWLRTSKITLRDSWGFTWAIRASAR